jgi:hypothetical protein
MNGQAVPHFVAHLRHYGASGSFGTTRKKRRPGGPGSEDSDSLLKVVATPDGRTLSAMMVHGADRLGLDSIL